MIDKVGAYTNVTSEEYHNDPCPEPSLSSSVAKKLWSLSPLHAMLSHPKLNPDHVKKSNEIMDVGTAAHSLLLENDDSKFVVVKENDWRKKVAQAARDEAWEKGLIPILEHKLNDVQSMVHVARNTITESELAEQFMTGASEKTLICKNNDNWLRARLDKQSQDNKFIFDLKTTGRCAKPDAFIRGNLFGMHYDLSAAFYLMLNEIVNGVNASEEASFIWIVQETEAPFACSLVGAGPSVVKTGMRKVALMLDEWEKCLKENEWPSYNNRIAWADTLPWVEAEVTEREALVDAKL